MALLNIAYRPLKAINVLMSINETNSAQNVMQRPAIAVGYFIFAMALIPLNDSLIKWMSSSLSIFQIMAVRAAIALSLALLLPVTWKSLAKMTFKTWLKILGRGFCLVGAMLFFFLPLATLSLADTTAIFFTAPLLISIMSVPLLGEKLGIYRIIAVICGLIGVLIIVKPGSSSFQLAYLLPVASAISYAAFQIITRYIRNEAEVAAMVAAQNMIYLLTGILGVTLIFALQPEIPDGDIWQFLLRPWQAPSLQEYGFFIVTAVIVLNLSVASTNVYSNVEATYVAPFEYIALPMAVLWGIVMWDDWPALSSWAGIALILSGGIFMIYRENKRDKTLVSSIPMRASVTNATAPIDDYLVREEEYEALPICF